MTKEIFALLNKENIKNSLSTVKRIGLKYERGSIGRKSESWRLRASTSNDDHRLKLTVLKERKTNFDKMSKEFKTMNGNSFLNDYI